MMVARSGVAPVTLRVLAVGSISLAALSRPPTLAATAAVIGLIMFGWSVIADDSQDDPHVFRWAGVVVILVLLFKVAGPVGRLTESEASVGPVWLGLLVTACAIAVVQGHRREARLISVVVAMGAVLLLTAVMSVGEWRSELGLDVYWMHRAAGEAIFNGENPYTDAVRVSNGSPFAPEGAVIEGYPYPPVAVATYGVAGAEADPRVVSSLAWLAVVGWMAWRARRPGREGDAAYAMFLLLAGLAVWPVVWFASWTEPLSVALLLLAALWWRGRPVLSAIALGLAIASKQYFIFLAPLLLLHRDESKWMRAAVSLGVAAATILLGLLPDPDAFVAATFLNLTDIGARPDAQSLPGLLAESGIDFVLSPLAWIVLGLGAAALIARHSVTPGDFVGRAGLAMGLVFFLGQAFPNYWFLVLGLIAIGSVVSEEAGGRAHPVGSFLSSSIGQPESFTL